MTSNASIPVTRAPRFGLSSRTSMRQQTGQNLQRFKTWLRQKTGRFKALQNRLTQEGSPPQNRVQQDKSPQSAPLNRGQDTDPPPYHTPSVNTEISTTITAIATALCTVAGAIPPGGASVATEVASIISILATAVAIVPENQAHATASVMSEALKQAVEVVGGGFVADRTGAGRQGYPGDRAGLLVAIQRSDEVLRTSPAARETVRKMLPCAWACISKLLLSTTHSSAPHIAIALNTAISKVAAAIASAPRESRVPVAVMYASSARRIADDSTRGIVTTEALEMSARLQGLDLLG